MRGEGWPLQRQLQGKLFAVSLGQAEAHENELHGKKFGMQGEKGSQVDQNAVEYLSVEPTEV